MLEKIWTKKFSPKGHHWGTQGPYLRRDRVEYFQNFKSSLFWAHVASLYQRISSPREKILQTFPPDVYKEGTSNRSSKRRF